MGFRVIKGKIKIGKMMKIVEEDRNCVIQKVLLKMEIKKKQDEEINVIIEVQKLGLEE